MSAAQDPAPSPAKLPLDSWHRAHGARMVTFAGYDMPIQYEGIVAEHLWTRAHASLFDVSHMGQLHITGEEARAGLERLLPADLGAMASGDMRYSLLMDESGGIRDDLIITRWETGYYLVVNGAVKAEDTAWLRAHLAETVALTTLSDSALLALQGPEAALALAALIPGVEALSFMQAGAFIWGSVPLWISRSGYTGEDGFEISLPASEATAFADALMADERVKPAGLGARDSLRLEAGLPLYGHDLSMASDPVSAGLSFALAKTRRESGGWLGHAPVMEVMASGPARKRIGLSLEGRRPAREGAAIYAGEVMVGQLTSGGFSPSLERPIAMGYVDSAMAAPGTALEIEVRGQRLPANVTKMPFIPHRYHRKGDR